MARIGWVIATLCLVSLASQKAWCENSRSYSDVVEILRQQFDRDVIPLPSDGGPVRLTVNLTLTNIREVDESRNEVEIDAWIVMAWNTGVSGLSRSGEVRLPVTEMWAPDITPYHGTIQIEENIRHNQAVITRDGNALWIPKSKIRLPCNVSGGSVDEGVTCSMKMGSWTYPASMVTLDSATSLGVSYFSEESLYEVLEVSAVRRRNVYSCCPETFEDILFTFSFKRK